MTEISQGKRIHSYDLTQRLAFFLIGIEVVFCGYLLLNAEKLGKITFSSTLFLLSGIAAVSGLFWRFFYNQTYHENVHGDKSRFHGLLVKVQWAVYWLYVTATMIFFIGIVGVGFQYLYNIEHGKSVSKNPNRAHIQQISNDIGKLQDGLEAISESINDIAKIEPTVIIHNYSLPPDSKDSGSSKGPEETIKQTQSNSD